MYPDSNIIQGVYLQPVNDVWGGGCDNRVIQGRFYKMGRNPLEFALQ